MSFGNRSDALMELLEELTDSGRQYVLVGDHAVSGDIRYMQVNSV